MFKSKLAFPLLGVLLFSFINWNCTKIDTTNIGNGLIPAVDNVFTFDTTLSVIANNFDSILTAGKVCTTIYPQEDYALGVIKNDPKFGTTQGTIFTEMKPEFFPFAWPASFAGMTLDSVVLCLSYRGSYGDSTQPQQVSVFELNNASKFTPDSNSCTTYNYGTTALGTATYTPQNLKDSVKAFQDTTSGQLRIRLSTTFGQRLLLQDSTHAFSNDSTFKAFFRGFAIVPNFSFGGNAISYFGMFDNNTKLNVYFRYKPGTSTKDSSVVFTFKTTLGLTATANNITRNHSGTELSTYFSPVPRPLGDTVIYIQAAPGTYAEIKIPGLTGLSNRIIHRAELIMDQVYSPPSVPDQYFTPPNFLYIDMKDSANGSYHTIPCDFNATTGVPDLTTFGGLKKTVKDPFGHDISRYTFNISRYVQKIVTTKRANNTIRLKAPDYIITTLGYTDDCGFFTPTLNYPLNDPALGRVKLGGGNNTNYRMKLHIIFSRL